MLFKKHNTNVTVVQLDAVCYHYFPEYRNHRDLGYVAIAFIGGGVYGVVDQDDAHILVDLDKPIG